MYLVMKQIINISMYNVCKFYFLCFITDIALNFKTEIGPTFRINLRQDILARLK